MRGKRRGRGRGNFSRNVHKVMRGELRVKEFGRKFTPTPIPNQIVQCPWNTMILSSSFTDEAKVTVKDLAQNVFFTLGMFDNVKEKEYVSQLKMSIRILKVEAWEMTGEPLMIIARSFIENSNDKEELTAVENLAGRMSFARVGYEWPSSHQIVVFHSDDDHAKVVFSVHFSQEAKVHKKCETRTHILWKGTIRSFPQFAVSPELGFESLTI